MPRVLGSRLKLIHWFSKNCLFTRANALWSERAEPQSMNGLDYSLFPLGARWSLLCSSPHRVSSSQESVDGFMGELLKRFLSKS